MNGPRKWTYLHDGKRYIVWRARLHDVFGHDAPVGRGNPLLWFAEERYGGGAPEPKDMVVCGVKTKTEVFKIIGLPMELLRG